MTPKHLISLKFFPKGAPIAAFSMWRQVLLFLLFCSQARGQATAAVGALDAERALLYRDISYSYDLEGTNVPIYAGHDEDLARLAQSSDSFVSDVAQLSMECDDIERKANKASARIHNQQEQAVSQGESADEAGKFLGDEANDDFFKAARLVLNSGFLQRNIANNIILQQASASIRERKGVIRRDMVRDIHNHPRGIPLDSKSFRLDFTNQDNVSTVVIRVRNDTGRTLHNCVLVAEVDMDGRKVDAEEQANAMSDRISLAFEALSGTSNETMNAQLAQVKSTDRVNRAPEGFSVFIPEWSPGQWIESQLIYYLAIRYARPGELTIATDQGFTPSIQMPVEELAAAAGRPLPPAPVLPKTPDELKVDTETLKKQHESVTEAGNNGIILYQFLSYPGVWSEAVVPPPGAAGFSIRWADGMKIATRVNGRDVADPAHFTCSLGDRLRFTSICGEPVPTAVRIVMRRLTPEEKQKKFIMPPWPPPKVVLSPDRQDTFDNLISILGKGPAFTGTFFQGNARYDIEASLCWDAESRLVTGWVSFPKLKVKKEIEGRFVDDGIKPLYLQLTETRFLESPRIANADLGLYYALNPDANSPGQLIGRWQFNQQYIGDKGRLFLQPVAK